MAIGICVAILIPLAYFFFISPVRHHPYLKREIVRYNGDGNIKDISLRFLVLPVPGYRITFTPFELDQPFSDAYTLSNLPDLGHVGIYLIVESESYFKDEERLKLDAKVEITLTNSKNEVVLKVDNYLKEMTWMYAHQGLVRGHALYNLDTSFFSPKKHEQYKLQIKYSPDETLSPRKGYVFIECGGHL